MRYSVSLVIPPHTFIRKHDPGLNKATSFYCSGCAELNINNYARATKTGENEDLLYELFQFSKSVSKLG